jgi:hypothetical protein
MRKGKSNAERKTELPIPRRAILSMYCPECRELRRILTVYNTTGVDVGILECGHRRTAFLPDLAERLVEGEA